MELDPIPEYSKTQRIVLLIDLNPILHLQNPTPYVSSILLSAKTLLSFAPFSSSTSSSLFAFKLFFSCLSPLLSSSKLHNLLPNCPASLSFDRPDSTFESLSRILNSVTITDGNSLCDSPHSMLPRASCLASSMRQLLHDYAWDPIIGDSAADTLVENSGPSAVRSNLVLLFSPACKTVELLSEFLNVDRGVECLEHDELLRERFIGLFESVKDAFVGRDIHLSWIDVSYDLECDKIKGNGPELKIGFFESLMKNLEWGFCSTNSIVLGSALVPFGLIYPKIGISPRYLCPTEISKKGQGQLALEIVDINGKPLECKCCDLELVELKTLPNTRRDDVLLAHGGTDIQTDGHEQKKTSSGCLFEGITKLRVKVVQKYGECERYLRYLSNPILLCDSFKESRKARMGTSSEFFADKVLEVLANEFGNSIQKSSTPIWQIFLSFLFKEGFCAFVSVSSDNGFSQFGILKPFTVSSAFLLIIEKGVHHPWETHNFSGENLSQPFIETDSTPCNNLMDSNAGPSPSSRCSQERVYKRNKSKKMSHSVKDLTWSSFYKAAFGFCWFDLGEVYFARDCNCSKKLKFLKCWLKQIKRLVSSSSLNVQKCQPQSIPQETDDRINDLLQGSEEPLFSSASAADNSLTEASRIPDEADLNNHSETSEIFFGNLSDKIQQGLQCEAVDLRALACRLVNSTIYWLSQKQDTQNSTPAEDSDGTNVGRIPAELTKLLLKEPKDLAAKPKKDDPSHKSSDLAATGFASENVAKEYELQIFFRMEILCSELRESIGESLKQKFVRQICLLLEEIQYHLEGGFFGDWSLESYVGKIIKSRYCQTLGDVVRKIYRKLDLLPFDDEDVSSNHLFNSEDSYPSGKGQPERDGVGEDQCSDELAAKGGKPIPVNASERPKVMENESACRLVEAQERRDRARRFSSFTSWVPDLHRVWAPKQLNTRKSKPDLCRKASKRKNIQRESCDMVCETPMTGKRRSCRRGSSSQEGFQDSGNNHSGSVSKVLFKDRD